MPSPKTRRRSRSPSRSRSRSRSRLRSRSPSPTIRKSKRIQAKKNKVEENSLANMMKKSVIINAPMKFINSYKSRKRSRRNKKQNHNEMEKLFENFHF